MNSRAISRRKLLTVGGIGLGTGLTGCTGILGRSETKEQETVTMISTDNGYHFDPHVVQVKPGDTVTWECKSGSHTTTAYHSEYDKPTRIPDGAAPWDSGTLSENDTFEYSFETEGIYDYYCSPHEAMGMLGSVIVGEPDANGQPGLAPPQENLPEKAQTKLVKLNSMVTDALGHAHGDATATESGGHHEDDHHKVRTEP